MILVAKTNLGREIEFESSVIPLTNRACQGVMLKNRIKLKKDEHILEIYEKNVSKK